MIDMLRIVPVENWILFILFIILYYLRFIKKNFKKNKYSGHSKNTRFWNILNETTNSPEEIRVSEVNKILDEAENNGCLKEFKTWLLKKKITPGVRVKIENYYDLHNKKIVDASFYYCENCSSKWESNKDQSRIFNSSNKHFQNNVWQKRDGLKHRCCPSCCEICWEWVTKETNSSYLMS